MPEILNIPNFAIQEITLPKCSVSDKVIMWEPLIITFLDVVDFKISTQLKEWITNGNAKQTIYIKEFNHSFNTINNWKIIGCQVKHIDFGLSTYDYGLLKKIYLAIDFEDVEIG